MQILPLLLLLLAPEPRDSYLTLGIRQVGEGDNEAAVFSLDTAIRRLVARPLAKADLAQAYLWLGAAYIGLDHPSAAKGKFRRALAIDPGIRASVEEFPARVLKAFDEVRLEGTARTRRKQALLALGGGGVVAAGAVGLAAAKGGHAPANRAPAVAIQVLPGGDLIVGLTEASFTASVADPDGDPVTVSWTLGDGTTASSETLRHVYMAEGTHTVTLSASDGKGAIGTATTQVRVRSLGGTWTNNACCGPSCGGGNYVLSFACTQAGPAIDCLLTNPPRDCDQGFLILAWRGTLTNPRKVALQMRFGSAPDRLNLDFDAGMCNGDAASDLDTINCMYQALGTGRSGSTHLNVYRLTRSQ